MAFLAGSGAYQQIIEITLTPTAIPGNTVSVETYTPSALAALDPTTMVEVNNNTTLPAGLIIAKARITAKGTVEVTFWNLTSTSITPGALKFQVLVF